MKLNPYHFLASSIFLAAIYLPFIIAISEDDKTTSEIEKRTLTQAPAFPADIQSLISFPKDFDTYYQDHFGFREKLTKDYRFLKYSIGDSPSKDVTIGKNGFLFLGTVKKGYTDFLDPMGDYRGVNKYTPEALSALVSYMDSLNQWFAQQGITYALVIAPNKATIYPEMLPNHIQKVSQESAFDQIVSALERLDNFLIVDLRKPLIYAKTKSDVYYKTDTHWNYFGANIAYQTIIENINYSQKKNLPILEANIQSSPWNGGDLANLTGVKPLDDQQDAPYFSNTCNPTANEHKDGNISIAEFNCGSGLFNLLVFGDSFSNWLKPFLSRTFKNSTFISDKLNFLRVKNQINTTKPDFIIEEWVERNLPYNPPMIAELQQTSKEKILFASSNKIVFQNRFSELQLYNAHTTVASSTEVTIESTTADPILVFPEINFSQGKQHVLFVNINSSVNSTFQVFFSELDSAGYPFSEENSIRIPIQQGNNEIYIQLKNTNLGKAFRLDPISALGVFTISEITIKAVD